MEFIIGLMLGVLVATLTIRWLAQRAIAKLLAQIEETSRDETEYQQLDVNLEFEQDIYFLYNSKDGSFVAQGANFSELKHNLRLRFPNFTVTINSGNAAALEKLKDQIDELKSITETNPVT